MRGLQPWFCVDAESVEDRVSNRLVSIKESFGTYRSGRAVVVQECGYCIGLL